jgi:release factor glutamine methyltransferase
VIAVVPYVPSEEFAYLPRDVRDHEPRLALDGGPGGTRVLEQAISAGAVLLHPDGTLLLEVGGRQDEILAGVLSAAGFDGLRRYQDDEGDLRGLEARLA